MMRKVLLLFGALGLVMSVQAASYPYLTFETSGGEKTSVEANGLTMTISGTNLMVGAQSFGLANLSKMYFSAKDETTDIEETYSESGVMAYYDLQGRLLDKDRLPAGICVIPVQQGKKVPSEKGSGNGRFMAQRMKADEEQVLLIQSGNVTYSFLASETGQMMFESGQRLTILGKEFVLSEVEGMQVDGTSETDVQVRQAAGETIVRVSETSSADSIGAYTNSTNNALWTTSLSGLRLRFDSARITHIEIESVDGYCIAGTDTADILMHDTYTPYRTPDKFSIVTYTADGTFTPGKDYYVPLFPTDLYGGYRLSIFKDGLVAHYFGVHQRAEVGTFITPPDLHEDQLEFDDPDAPLVEDERPGLNEETKQALAAYKHNPTEANKQALLEMMGMRYDKVVARKKAKLRELEREAHHQSLIDEMQAIVDEMVENRDIRIEQQFVRLIDPREDEDPNDAWLVLRGANVKANNPYIAYAPVTNAEYAAFNTSHSYTAGQDNWPVVNISYTQAEAYCAWLSANDTQHTYRLPTEEEWILAAGHMPKDVVMNTNHVESSLTAVDAYAQTTGACGGIDFWGNCWEWTSTTNDAGQYIIKGGAWDTTRDECRTEYSDDARNGTQGYANVGIRVVRVDKYYF